MSYRSHPLLEVSLPENVLFEVLSRLPVKTIITCKCVCKRWRGLVEDPYFVDLHLSKSCEEALMILEFSSNSRQTLKWLEMEHEHEHLDTVKSLNLTHCEPPITTHSRLFLIGSVNGLVSLGYTNQSFYILNPMLEEYMSLPPPPPRPQASVIALSYGFGVSTAGEYKVIRLFINLSKTPEWAVEIQVHTLGTDQWRSLRQTWEVAFGDTRIFPNQHGVFLNSHMYWLIGVKIYDFDFTTETFESFPSPRAASVRSSPRLGVLKGSLSQNFRHPLGLEVWVMKGGSWCKEIAIQETISRVLECQVWSPLWLIGGLEDTCILMLLDTITRKLAAYCLNTNAILYLNQETFWLMTYRPSFIKMDNFRSERVHSIPRRIHSQGMKETRENNICLVDACLDG